MSKSWREDAATSAVSSILESQKSSTKRTRTNQPYAHVKQEVHPIATCEGCYAKEGIMEVGVGNKMYSEEPHMVLHLCPTCRAMLGQKLIKSVNKENNHEYIVERIEKGMRYVKVITPADETTEDVQANFTMAAKYAQTELKFWNEFNEKEKSDYDEHFAKMGAYRESHSGDETFAYYLTTFCGYEVEAITFPLCDFSYEW